MQRIVLGGLAAICLVAAVGCAVGPVKNRLYVSEWKTKVQHPIKLQSDWVYEGEHWEHMVLVEEEGG